MDRNSAPNSDLAVYSPPEGLVAEDRTLGMVVIDPVLDLDPEGFIPWTEWPDELLPCLEGR